ncbi:MAG TPA: 3,4-dihydroxy-2-butanone-4-phosphate synthase [Arenicellales bacterium]|nr:3,4-dihydroxy-2-butanone-4-phosphate synthase [Arenicellales bacterium]
MPLASIPEVIEEYRRGRMVIITDDENRENEGDLLIAAEKVTAQDINFMATNARGLICLTLTPERCQRLGLELMVGKNASRFSTNFTVSIEAASGVTTGISAADRARTVQAAVHPDAQPSDLISPGHIFPLMAQPGGVLTRAGHTEAGVDLARLAGFEPASVICEVLRPDGSMARREDLIEFAREHDLKISSVAELIRYRLEQEPTVSRAGDAFTEVRGHRLKVVAYQDMVEDITHLALVKGDIDPAQPTLVRVHVESGVYDVFRRLEGAETWAVGDAVERICRNGSGVVVIVRYPEDSGEMIKRIQHAHAEGKAIEFPWRESGQDLRMLGVGGQILADLGVTRLRVLGSPKRLYGLSGFGLEIVDYVTE